MDKTHHRQPSTAALGSPLQDRRTIVRGTRVALRERHSPRRIASSTASRSFSTSSARSAGQDSCSRAATDPTGRDAPCSRCGATSGGTTPDGMHKQAGHGTVNAVPSATAAAARVVALPHRIRRQRDVGGRLGPAGERDGADSRSLDGNDLLVEVIVGRVIDHLPGVHGRGRAAGRRFQAARGVHTL
jgi:hypothetical protein